MMERAQKPPPVDEGRAGSAGMGGRPHTLRDEYGFYRTRGYFQGYQQSPAPGARGSLYNPQSARGKSSLMKSPGSYNI